MELFSTMNIVDAIIDEIALEGLDGITLEALWNRMAMRYREKVPLPQKLMEQIWNICLQIRELSFYELETPREKLVIFDRYEFVDPDIGMILEPDVVPNDIYTHCPIDDLKNGIKGSCSTYYTRKDISSSVKSLTVHEAEKNYGRSLVIVASQPVRENALMDKSACPTLDITGIRYCFLERVGRSRYQGEVTQGKLSLGLMNEDPKSLFYHRQYLLRHKLITKQFHHQKSGRFSCSGSLMHLPRFYVERKPKVIYLAEKVIEILKSRENQVAEYSEIRKELRIENSIKKLFKTVCFQSVVKTDLLVPYRTLYPNADKNEWQRKNNSSKEKMLRVVQLIDSDVDISDIWTKDEILEEEDPFELDITEQKYSVPFLRQANEIIESSKHDGLGQSELARKMGLAKLQARTICRSLSKANIVANYMNDMGRQRVTKYVSRKFADSSRMSKQLQREMCKIKELTKASVVTKSSPSSDETKWQNKTNELSSRLEDSEQKEAKDEDKISSEEIQSGDIRSEDEEKNREICPENIDDPRIFKAATKILQKYKLTAYRRKYKRTFKNVVGMENELLEAAGRSKRPKLMQATKEDKDFGERSESESKPLLLKELEEKLMITQPSTTQKRDDYIVGLMKDVKNADEKNASNVSYRLLKRARIIIEIVRELKVIDDLTKLMKVITEEEEREGYDVKIDKKSLIRLLQRLAKDDLVKNIKLTLSANGKEKSLTFICDPNIDVNHTVIRSAVEQAKIKFCLIGAQKVKTILQSNTEKLELSGENADDVSATEKLNEIDKESKKIVPSNLVFDRKAGRHYGYTPKFIRMQTLHAFLFYLIYEHSGKPRESKEKLLEILRNKGLTIDKSLEKEIGGIFNTEVGWKMFVPPLPKHNGWPLGWALMCDILLRVPLSIFLKIHKVAYRIPELEQYTSHPIRKHLLVKDLPAPIRNLLLIRRKYIFSIHDAITRLCYIGLVQFGPQKLKEKDKVFIYLNRNTELMDTTTSAAHYHKIEDKLYPLTKYTFTSLQTIDKYWYKLWSTCINTRLGGRLVVQGKDIILEDLDKKPAMIEATKPRSPEEAALMDLGHVPGDRMGAAGIDSAFFAHLKRNWNWESSNYPFQKGCGQFSRSKAIFEGERDAYMSKVRPKPLRFTEFHGFKKITGPATMDVVDLKKPLNGSAKNSVLSSSSSSKKLKKPSRSASGKSSSNRQRSYVRRVLPRRRHVRPRVKYDEIDYSALQRMDKLRVDWDTREDNILLVCKVAMMYLCPNPRRQLITFTAVRDVLRSYSLSSYNKTSRACQRRLLYMLKKPQTFHSVTLGVEELKQNFYVNKRFGDIVDKLKKDYRNPPKYDEQLTLIFRDLVAYIAKKHYDISDIQSSTPNYTPSTVEEFNLFHRIKYPTKSTSIQGYHDDTTNDIHSSTINSVIHSSMCCGKDRRSWAYQLFRIYQQYPEWLLRSAMAKIRTDQMVTIKKHYVFAMRKQANACMPMSSSQYQLSSGYTQKFNTKLPYSVFKESWDFFVKLVRHYRENVVEMGEDDEEDKAKDRSGVETVPVTGGTIAAIHDYINIDRLDFDIEIPRHIIMLDPTLQKDDERYIKIARRYQDILRNLEHFHMDVLFDEPEETKFSEIDRIEVDASSSEKTIAEARKDPEVVEKISLYEGSERPSLDSNNLDHLYVRKNLEVSKSQESNEPQINTDTEVFGSDHEVNFEEEEEEDEDDSWEDLDDEDREEDDLICFLDNTKIRLTAEDIERSGLRIDSENVYLRDNPRNSFLDSSSKRSKENIDEEEANNSTKRRNEEKEIKNEVEPIASETMEVEVEINEKEKEKGQSMRVNEIIERSNYLRDGRGPYYRTADPKDVDKRYTRIALLKMREELNDLTPNDSHHAHEYFVLNMFKIFYSLQESKLVNPEKVSTIHELEVPTELLPLKKDVYSKLIADLKKFAIFPRVDISYSKFRRELPAGEMFKRGLDAVYEFLLNKKEVGASLEQLATRFYAILGNSLDEILRVLKEGRLVLRSGVKNTRYIHQTHADPWLIHSYKIMRLQKECQQIVPAGSMYVIGEERNEGTGESKASEPSNVEEEVDDDVTKKNLTANECEATQSKQRKMQKSRTCLLQTKEVYRAAKQLDLDTAEEIRVVVRPWIRVDGDLNRRVLDRMLGGVLAYCLIHPGVYLTKVQERFAPAIQPFHTKELVEILVTLECLQIGTARKTRVTLFSKSSSAKPVFASVTERCEWAENEIVIEPVLGATLKFAMFLSNRTYTSDFLDNSTSPTLSASVRNR